MANTLEIIDLHAGIEGKEILKGIDLAVKTGEIHAIMGPNGSGKSTLAYTMMGHPKYKLISGDIKIDGVSIKDMPPNERALRGLFLGFQYPLEIPGVSLANFLRISYNAVRKDEPMLVRDFRKMLEDKFETVGMERSFATRYLNEGFSGGEKKKAEVVQLAVLRPKFAVLDETDSGLDIDALKLVSNGINSITSSEIGIMLITHYQRILRYVKPDFVHVLVKGKVAVSGGAELAQKLEEKGYAWISGAEEAEPEAEVKAK
ncbi:MAG TPA: Fe-S cluster assembly ATPase SufC [Nitrososphaerales archaeon]|nr:Fe-S cluster assembly ATPase SufC [Nitrososphaerales archaeon]